jgi:bifunctional non-homologous end joining protein LigD
MQPSPPSQSGHHDEITFRTVPNSIRKSKAWDDYCDAERPLERPIKRLGKMLAA